MGLHRDPDAAELLAAVREFLTDRVMAETDGALRFHARVAANVLAVVERELELGPAGEAAHEARLAQLGVADDGELAAGIRSGAFDDRLDQVLRLVRASVDDKVAVANPRWAAD